MTFAEKLADLRRHQGMSQEQLADRLGVTRQSVSKWESGAAMPELAKLIALSELFHVSVDYLVKDTITEEMHESHREEAVASRLEAKVDRLTRQVDPTVYAYTSKTRVFGLPLVSVRFSRERGPSRSSTAIGIIAVGNFAVGLVSIGLISAGVLSVGMIAFGLLLALGGVSIGTVAIGASAMGIYAFGAAAVGQQLAVGSAATGKIAIGLDAKGNHALSLSGTSLEEVEAFLTLYGGDLWKPIRGLAILVLRFLSH
jgi:transcriptional regulator with XRE-family HTH domain